MLNYIKIESDPLKPNLMKTETKNEKTNDEKNNSKRKRKENFNAFDENQINKFIKLALFMINLILVPHSNCFVERMFSHVSQIKNDIRNNLDVATVSSILKIKSFYLNDKKSFESTEDHLTLSKSFIKSI